MRIVGQRFLLRGPQPHNAHVDPQVQKLIDGKPAARTWSPIGEVLAVGLLALLLFFLIA
jgi:hypothetical protein